MKNKTPNNINKNNELYEKAVIKALYKLDEIKTGIVIKKSTPILELRKEYHWLEAYKITKSIEILFGIQYGYMETQKVQFGDVGYLINILRVHKVKLSDVKKLIQKLSAALDVDCSTQKISQQKRLVA